MPAADALPRHGAFLQGGPRDLRAAEDRAQAGCDKRQRQPDWFDDRATRVLTPEEWGGFGRSNTCRCATNIPSDCDYGKRMFL